MTWSGDRCSSRPMNSFTPQWFRRQASGQVVHRCGYGPNRGCSRCGPRATFPGSCAGPLFRNSFECLFLLNRWIAAGFAAAKRLRPVFRKESRQSWLGTGSFAGRRHDHRLGISTDRCFAGLHGHSEKSGTGVIEGVGRHEREQKVRFYSVELCLWCCGIIPICPCSTNCLSGAAYR